MDIMDRAKGIVAAATGRDEKLLQICRLIRDSIPRCDWVGFYIVDPDKGDELMLGPFVGEPTAHVRIPFGRGICGTAAAKGETIVVGDVSKEANYLSCGPAVRSEIVVPIFKGTAVVAELDIDSHIANAFGPEERSEIEGIARIAVGVL